VIIPQLIPRPWVSFTDKREIKNT